MKTKSNKTLYQELRDALLMNNSILKRVVNDTPIDKLPASYCIQISENQLLIDRLTETGIK